MSGHYSGVNRMSWKMTLAFLGAIALLSYCDYSFFFDAAYFGMVTEVGRKWYTTLPRPIFQVFFGAATLGGAAVISGKLWNTLRGKPAFEISADGIRSWPMFQKSQFMPWHAMRSAKRDHGSCVVKGVTANGRERQIWFDMTGHDWEVVLTVIATYRRDIANAVVLGEEA